MALTPTWVDRLRSGIWPKPFVFWAVVFYIGLFIIRPWERLFPELGELRFERLSVLAIMAIITIISPMRGRRTMPVTEKIELHSSSVAKMFGVLVVLATLALYALFW